MPAGETGRTPGRMMQGDDETTGAGEDCILLEDVSYTYPLSRKERAAAAAGSTEESPRSAPGLREAAPSGGEGELRRLRAPARKGEALRRVSFRVSRGEIFALLGPNGSGKSTLFKILSTIMPPGSGKISVLGLDLPGEQQAIRRLIGVVFQHPSLDLKLTARENLRHQGHLYGLRGAGLSARIAGALKTVEIAERADDIVEQLSGGLQRRVELAKCLLHKPRLLILDEPSTGLDPGARRDFAATLRALREREGVTVLLTTHILDEAEHCDRIAILDQGELVALGTPTQLRHEIGGEIISVTTGDPAALAGLIAERFGGDPKVVGQTVRLERTHGHEFIPQLVEAFPGRIDSVTLARPTLEDVFIQKTGHRFWSGSGGEADS